MEENSCLWTENNNNHFSLREFQILEHIVEGKSNREIANELYISVYTVKTYVASILEKMSVSNRLQAAVKAVRDKLFCFLIFGCLVCNFADLSSELLCSI